MAEATAFPLTSSFHSTQSIAFSESAGRNSLRMMASSELRRDLHDSNGASRPSLPSIAKIISPSRSDPISLPKPVNYSLPSPFVSRDRAYQSREKHSMPQPIHQSSFTSRQDHTFSFSQSSEPSFNDGPESIVADPRSITSSKAEHPPQQTPTNCEQPRSVSGNHLPRGPHSSHPYQGNGVPPSQVPSNAYPIASRYIPNEVGFRRVPYEPSDYAPSNNRCLPTRQYEPGNYQEAFGRVS